MNGATNHHAVNGGSQQRNGPFSSTLNGRVKVPSVSDALPYTPFASIVPFDSALIKSPSATVVKSENIMTMTSEQFKASRKLIDQLSNGATRAEDASERCQRTIHDVKRLIQSRQSNYYKMQKTNQQSITTDDKPSPLKLSNFAKLVFDNLETESISTVREDTLQSSHVSEAEHEKKSQQAHQSRHQKAKTSNLTSMSQNGAIYVVDPTPVTHSHQTDPSRLQRSVSGTHASVQIDQKLKSDVSVNVLSDLVQSILDADDAINAGEQLDDGMLAIFRNHETDEASHYVLSAAYQSRLESAVQKCTAAGRLHSIATDDLKRVEKICESIVTLSTDLSLQLIEDPTDSEVEEWEQRLHTAESSLLGIRIVLKIMTASSSEQELQSEDLVLTMLNVIRTVAETGLVATVEMNGSKKGMSESAAVRVAYQNRDQLVIMLKGFTKVLRYLGGLLDKVKIDEAAITTIIYTCKILIFAENATTDRDSLLGVQTFELTRRSAMDILARIFDKYPEHRTFIWNEILLSLEKLPASKQTARQYRIADARPVQLVSALIMLLIQTSATKGGTKMSAFEATEVMDESDHDEDEEGEDNVESGAGDVNGQTLSLQSLVSPLIQAAQGNVRYFTETLVQRALKTAKNSDEPHRKLLDIFTEDFLNVFGLPEWPAAELLLTALLRQMVAIAEQPKSTGQARTFAIESLGNIASGILQLQQKAQGIADTTVQSESASAARLRGVLKQVLINDASFEDLLQADGPYRAIVEYLYGKHNDAQAHTAIGCYLMQWAQQLCSKREKSADTEEDDTDRPMTSTQTVVHAMMLNKQWLETHNAYDAITDDDAKIAALCLTSSSILFRAVHKIFHVLFSGLDSDQTMVKGRSLRSIVTVIETDPETLDRNAYVLNRILNCMEDSSTLVRDAALNLITKCVTLRPQLDTKVVEYIIKRTRDPAVIARKRALKMLKDMYLRNESLKMRSNIASAIIRCGTDAEDSIIDLVKQTMEDIWFEPFYAYKDSDASAIISLKAHASLLVATVESDEQIPDALITVLQAMLLEAKNKDGNIAVSRRIVEVLFNGFTDTKDFSETLTQSMFLQVVAVFTQALPKLITTSQLELLEPYTKNLQSTEDLTIFRMALTVLRHAMPHTTGLPKQFLLGLQSSLFTSLNKLPDSEYSEVAACLWTIAEKVQNADQLVSTTIAATSNLRKLAAQAVDDAHTKKIVRLAHLIGQLGKACDLEVHVAKIRSSIPGTKSNTVAGIIIESLALFANKKISVERRQAALQSICAVCQRWPREFLRPDVDSFFNAVLKEGLPELEMILLEGLLGFFSSQEISVTANADEPIESGRERLAKTYASTDQDGATASLSQKYLPHIIRLATSSVDRRAIIATKLMASIVRQGLPHPKECGPSLIALETSPILEIAQIACAEHRTLHEKHETIIEKEYMRAMSQALSYQQIVVGDAKGWTSQPPSPKLAFFWDVLKSGKVKVRQKFITNICAKLSFDTADLQIKDNTSPQLVFARFVVENIALFDYDKAEDVRLLIDSLAKAFATTGAVLAQSIDSEVFNMTVDAVTSSQLDQVAPQNVDNLRLQKLAISAQILLIIAEARDFLMRVWGGHRHSKKEKSGKDSTKSATRSSNAAAHAEAFVKKTAQLCQPCIEGGSQRAICQKFADVMSTDHEVKVGTDDEDDGDDGSDIRSPSTTATGTPSKKRKSSASAGGPRKRGRPRKTPSFNRIDEDEDADGEWE